MQTLYVGLFYFYCASTSPLLRRGAHDTARILCRGSTLKRHRQLHMSGGFVQGPNVAARGGFEPSVRKASTLPMGHHAPRYAHGHMRIHTPKEEASGHKVILSSSCTR